MANPSRRPIDRRPGDQHVVVYIHDVDAAAAKAVGYVRSIRPENLWAVTYDPGVSNIWSRLAPEIPLVVLEDAGWGRRSRSLRQYLSSYREDLPGRDFFTIVIPELLRKRGLIEILLRPRLHRLKASLRRLTEVQVMDIPVVASDLVPNVDLAHEPGRNTALVLISGVHNATLQAIEYAETLRPTSVRGVSIELDPKQTRKLGDRWMEHGVQVPLDIVESPYRDIGSTLRSYIRSLEPDGVNKIVTVVIPEFVVAKRRHELLHGQTALLVKRHLLFETGVVVASVPFKLDD